MRVRKPQSKRTPVRLRHSIAKHATNKQRKERKIAKKDPTWRSRLKKDPGIPNLFPYKEKLLQEIEEKKSLKEQETIRRREETKARNVALAAAAKGISSAAEPNVEDETSMVEDEDVEDDEDMDVDTSNGLAAFAEAARARAKAYAQQRGDDEELDAMHEDNDDSFEDFDEEEESGGVAVTAPRKDSSRKQFDKAFRQVVDAADIILYVLDARDPEGTRSPEVEQMVRAVESGSKTMIFVLNKIDLVPPPVLKGWKTHLERSWPTVPLRASNPAPNARTFDHKQLTTKSTSETLLDELKQKAHSMQLSRSVSVGIIGYPNVGKSSVINALTSRRGGRVASCPTGAEAGVTTSVREVKLDNKLKLLDSPGIVFPTAGEKATQAGEQARLILLNAVSPKDIEDPMPAVALLLKRLSSSQEMFNKMLQVYQLPALMPQGGDLTKDFLIQVARKRGRLGKGGVPNLHAAGMTVIGDWRDGRIQGWTDAPILQLATANAVASNGASSAGASGDIKAIVKERAPEFDPMAEVSKDSTDAMPS